MRGASTDLWVYQYFPLKCRTLAFSAEFWQSSKKPHRYRLFWII
nr:MAG TPA: hypothetical protein [Caudoviricetes sp.]